MKRFKKLALSILGVTVLSLGLYACSNDGDDLNTSNSQDKTDNELLSKALSRASTSTEDYVNDFVKKHVEINDKIISILENEPNFNSEIINEYSSEDIASEVEFKNILQKSGVIKYNELTTLIMLQVENSKIFQSNNPTFFKISKIEQDEILTKYIHLIISNNYQVNGKCADEFKKASGRCEDSLNLHGTFALIGCFGGPWACALGTVLVAAEHTNCIKYAKEDYKDCLKG